MGTSEQQRAWDTVDTPPGSGGMGTLSVNYTTGEGTVTFNRPVTDGADILADYDRRRDATAIRIIPFASMVNAASPWPGCPVRMKVSGDAGSTWETLNGWVAKRLSDGGAIGDFWWYLGGESTDPTRWTSDSVWRFEYNGNIMADTPEWTDYTATYHQGFALDGLSVFAEFDWDFQA